MPGAIAQTLFLKAANLKAANLKAANLKAANKDTR